MRVQLGEGWTGSQSGFGQGVRRILDSRAYASRTDDRCRKWEGGGAGGGVAIELCNI